MKKIYCDICGKIIEDTMYFKLVLSPVSIEYEKFKEIVKGARDYLPAGSTDDRTRKLFEQNDKDMKKTKGILPQDVCIECHEWLRNTIETFPVSKMSFPENTSVS